MHVESESMASGADSAGCQLRTHATPAQKTTRARNVVSIQRAGHSAGECGKRTATAARSVSARAAVPLAAARERSTAERLVDAKCGRRHPDREHPQPGSWRIQAAASNPPVSRQSSGSRHHRSFHRRNGDRHRDDSAVPDRRCLKHSRRAGVRDNHGSGRDRTFVRRVQRTQLPPARGRCHRHAHDASSTPARSESAERSM